MRLLLINGLFDPEPNFLKGVSFARELQRRGYDVHVLTGFPNYPDGKVYPGYKMQWTHQEVLDGVPVIRVAMYPSHDQSALRGIAGYSSIGLSQAVHTLTLRKRFDLCHVYLGPVPLLWPAWLLKHMHGTKVVADIQDIWPESVADSGMLNSPTILKLLTRVSTRSYQIADRVMVPTESYRAMLCRRGLRPDQVDVVYNWCDESKLDCGNGENIPPGILDDKRLNVVYAGNLGKLQSLDTVLDAAKLLAGDPAIRFLLIGGGVDANRIGERLRREQITNVNVLPRMSPLQLSPILARADLLLIHLAKGELARISIPSKLQSNLAAGRPLLVAVEGEASELFGRTGAGMSCEPENPRAMAEAIGRFKKLSVAERDEMGRRGRQFYRDVMCFEKGVDRIEKIFLETVAAAGSRV